MRPLLTTDPEAIGPYRLLARIGTGGMGVVYLARSEGGTLAAVKVIRAEHAADPSFRARFRREARAAARVDARWTTPVLAADPEAPEPWLATAFVPGPSLAEIIAGHGPLPPGTVRALGARLVEALTAVHAAGLVHRDIKPGNVLLALDGPRLIDFGIARTGGATALTATDVVIGTPGYLSPEQARARGGEPGPPSDVFSLGCLLAYAAAGRPPYGTGMAASVIFRTIHEAPDLTGVPDDPLRTLIARCLAKSPAARPTLPELRVALGHFGTDDWLPPGLPALIAERSAQVLDLPEPQRTEPPTLVAGPSTPTRRRFLLLGTSAGVLAAGGATAAWYATRSSAARDAVPSRTIAVHADLTGPGKGLGTAVERGVRLAAAQHNARADRSYDLVVQSHDDRGEADRARAVARRLVTAGRVSAVIGPTSDSTALAVRDIYNTAQLPLVTAWSDSDALYVTQSTQAAAVFQIRPQDDALAAPLVHYLAAVRPAARRALISDGAAIAYSWQISGSLAKNTPPHGTVVTPTVAAGSDDFGPAVAAAMSARAQAVVYCGRSPVRAAACARALRAAGFTGTAAATEPVLGPAFLEAAGSAAEGWVFSATFVDPARLDSAAGFVRAYEKRYAVHGVPVGAAEAYDAAGMVMTALTAAGTGHVDPGTLAHRLRALSYRGVTRTFAFDASTGAVQLNSGLFLWQVRRGEPVFLGQYQQVTRA